MQQGAKTSSSPVGIPVWKVVCFVGAKELLHSFLCFLGRTLGSILTRVGIYSRYKLRREEKEK